MKGNYLDDKQFKHDFTMYLRELWDKKDNVIEEFQKDYKEAQENNRK